MEVKFLQVVVGHSSERGGSGIMGIEPGTSRSPSYRPTTCSKQLTDLQNKLTGSSAIEALFLDEAGLKLS